MSKLSSLWQKEDWWAVWIGFIILISGTIKCLPSTKILSYTSISVLGDYLSFEFRSLFEGRKNDYVVISTIAIFFILLILTLISLFAMKKNIKTLVPSFIVVFCVTLLSMWLGKYTELTKWGLETVLWALVIGLIISNVFKIPQWMKAGIQTELFIKVGLVLLGAEILFSTIVKGGLIGMGQALVVVLAVWFFAYWLGRKFGMNKTFASTMASGVSICGVSAAIASGGAVKGNPRETSYVISVVLLLAMPMLIGMPILSKALGLSPAVAGAWMGGTIDTTGAVVAAGTLVDPKMGLQVASLVKMAQNVFIGFAAFFLAIWVTFTNKTSDTEKPSVMEIWYRFPKFILGFVLASVIFSLIIEPSFGSKETSVVLSVTKGYREWFFALAFVCIGLETRFKDLIAVGKGKPLAVFCIAQVFNVVFTFGIVWLLWSGNFIPLPL